MRSVILSRVLPASAFLLISAAGAIVAQGQPTDAQLKKELTGPKTVSLTLVDKPGQVKLNTDTLVYEWTRGFTAKLRTETPDVFVIVKGVAVYNVVAGKYLFRRTRIISNNYEGIPDPSPEDVKALIDKFGYKEFVGAYHYQNAVGEIESLRLVDEPKFEWHTPNSVSFEVVAILSQKVSYTEVERVEQRFNIRLYRDDVKQPWARMMSTPNQGDGGKKVLGKKTYTADQLRRLPGPTKP